MSFRLKTILGIALIESILLVILIVSGLKLLDSIQHDGLTKRAESTTKVLASTAKEAVLASDLATLDTFTSEFITNPEVVYIQILDSNQDLLSSAGMTTIQNSHKNNATDKSSSIIVSRSKIMVENTLFGYVEAAYSKEDLIAIYGKAKTSAIAIAITELVLVALFSFFLGTYLSSQLSSLKKAAEVIATGDYSVSMKERGKDEIAQVAKAFNIMTEKLREKKQIDDTNFELLASIQQTKPTSIGDNAISIIFEYVLERFIKLTNSSLGLILTLDDNDNILVQSVLHSNCLTLATPEDKKEVINSFNLEPFRESINEVIETNHLVETNKTVDVSFRDQVREISSYVTIPINHQGEVKGLVILSNYCRDYNHDFLLDTNRLAWLAISNLIYIDNNNQHLEQTQQNLKNQRNFITSVNESVPDAIISISKTGEITTLNKATSEIFGYRQDELLGKNINILMPEPYKSMHDGFLYDYVHSTQKTSNTILAARELNALSKTGDLIPIELTINHINNPEGKSGYVGVIKDITRQKKQIEEIKYANRLATQSFVDRHHFISALNRFVLTSTIELNDKIQSTLLFSSPDNDTGLYKDIYTHSNILLNNTKNIIYYTNLVSGSIRLNKTLFNLRSMVEEISRELTLDSSSQAVNFNFDLSSIPSDHYYHDATHIKLVLTRLIQYLFTNYHDLYSVSMAITKNGEFGKKDQIDVSINGSLKQGEILQQQNTDDDMGFKIATLMLSYLNGNHNQPLSENFVIYSPEENSITIQIKLKLTRAETSPDYSTSSIGTVLLVDNDNQFLNLTRHMLENIGFIVQTASNGKEAIDKFIDNYYTAILIDCSLPVMDGYEATLVIREYEESKFLTSTPIIATTGHLEKNELESCLLSGINDYIHKPFNIEDLILKLGLHISETDSLNNSTLFTYNMNSDPNTITNQFVEKASEYLAQISTCLSKNNWQALKYCVLSLQNMSLATNNLNIHELAILVEYQSKLSDQSAIKETIKRIESKLIETGQVNDNTVMQVATKN